MHVDIIIFFEKGTKNNDEKRQYTNNIIEVKGIIIMEEKLKSPE